MAYNINNHKTKTKQIFNFNFDFDLGEKLNGNLLNKVFDKAFINNNQKNYKNSKGKQIIYEYKINPEEKDINPNEKNKVFLFTYEYFINNGLLLKLDENFFQMKSEKYKRFLKKIIEEINKNIKKLGEKRKDFGFLFSNNLYILYITIKNIKYFILDTQLYGEAKSISQLDLENLIKSPISNVSNNTSDIAAGNFYEETILDYFLNNPKIHQKYIFSRLLLYMNFIILNYNKNKDNIEIEMVPFNQLNKNKTEFYDEVDFCFYASNEIRIPMNKYGIDIFKYTLALNNKNKTSQKTNQNELIFPSQTLTFFELKNNVPRKKIKKEDDKYNNSNLIDLTTLLESLTTFISKVPIYIDLYKSKKFINENYKSIKLVYFYDNQNSKFEDSKIAKTEINKIIKEKLQYNDININLEIVFGNKRIQSINYYELLFDNNRISEELKKTQNSQIKTEGKLKKTEEELKKIQNNQKNTEENLKKTQEELKKKQNNQKNTEEELKKTQEELKKQKKCFIN